MFGTSALLQQCCEHLLAGSFGAFALTEYSAEKLYRDARIFQIFEGTGEILRELIGRVLVREV